MKKQNTILFIPGFKGSTLLNQKGELVWPNFLKAQFNHTISLSNHLPNIGIVNPNSYVSSEIVKSVSVLSGLLRHDIYGKFINSLQKQLPSDTELKLFPYDWRQDLTITTDKIISLIETIAQEKSGQIDIICHSMGGLIVSRLIQMVKTNNIRQVFFVGVPFQGALRAILDLINGSPFGLNKTLLSPKAMGSFPSVYYLLPQYPQITEKYDFLDIETWKRYKVGYLAKQKDPNQLDFLSLQLQQAKNFHEQRTLHKNKNTIKLIFINNFTPQTPIQIEFTPELKVHYGNGDGTVPGVSLNVPNYFKDNDYEIHQIEKSHGYAFTSNKLLGIITSRIDS